MRAGGGGFDGGGAAGRHRCCHIGSKEEIPVRFGGTGRFEWFDSLFDFELYTIGRSTAREVTVKLASDQTLEYAVRIQTGTIGVALDFRPATGDKATVQIRPPTILDAAKAPVARGVYTSPSGFGAGMVVIKLDNESAWVWAKTVELSTTLTFTTD